MLMGKRAEHPNPNPVLHRQAGRRAAGAGGDADGQARGAEHDGGQLLARLRRRAEPVRPGDRAAARVPALSHARAARARRAGHLPQVPPRSAVAGTHQSLRCWSPLCWLQMLVANREAWQCLRHMVASIWCMRAAHINAAGTPTLAGAVTARAVGRAGTRRSRWPPSCATPHSSSATR